MGLVYVHLSDIHFGQEKGGQLVINDDVKDQLISDVRDIVSKIGTGKAEGIIISGDIAYAGKKSEYESAGAWLDRLTAAAGCDRPAVQVVPGNHDIDMASITPATQTIIDEIAQKGDPSLDKYLEEEEDRELLYKRFSEYRIFAEAYNCPLDGEGTIKGSHTVEIASGRHLRFHGINTALICSKSKTELGSLLLGKRQRVIPIDPCIETIVIGHHPMHWLQDSEDALLYIKNRARVFISGHEHAPSHKVETVTVNCDLLSLASGATAPPKVDEVFTYCYNVIQFDWDEQNHRLQIVLYPRMWNNEKKAFDQDSKNFTNYPCTFELRCRGHAGEEKKAAACIEKTKEGYNQQDPENEKAAIVDNSSSNNADQILLLRFFRELSGKQRIEVLVKLGALPEGVGNVNHSVETNALKLLFTKGMSDELHQLINQILSPKK